MPQINTDRERARVLNLQCRRIDGHFEFSLFRRMGCRCFDVQDVGVFLFALGLRAFEVVSASDV